MKILVIGGTGVISTHIIAQGLKAGHEMVAFNRGSKPVAPGAKAIIGDRANDSDFFALADIGADVVIDMIAFDENDAAKTVEVFGGKVRQIIITSSIAAYERPYKSLPIREENEALTTSDIFPYGYKKANMERYLLKQMSHYNTPITIIRPSLIFGENCKNLGFLRQNYNIVNRIRSGKPLVMIGETTIPWAYTFASDVGRAYIGLCGNEKAYNQAYHLANDNISSTWGDLYAAFGKILGKEPIIYNIPSDLLYKADPALFAHFVFEKKYASLLSTDKLREAIPDFKWQISLEEGLRSVIASWEASGDTSNEAADLLEDKLCAAYMQFEAIMEAL